MRLGLADRWWSRWGQESCPGEFVSACKGSRAVAGGFEDGGDGLAVALIRRFTSFSGRPSDSRRMTWSAPPALARKSGTHTMSRRARRSAPLGVASWLLAGPTTARQRSPLMTESVSSPPTPAGTRTSACLVTAVMPSTHRTSSSSATARRSGTTSVTVRTAPAGRSSRRARGRRRSSSAVEAGGPASLRPGHPRSSTATSRYGTDRDRAADLVRLDACRIDLQRVEGGRDDAVEVCHPGQLHPAAEGRAQQNAGCEFTRGCASVASASNSPSNAARSSWPRVVGRRGRRPRGPPARPGANPVLRPLFHRLPSIPAEHVLASPADVHGRDLSPRPRRGTPATGRDGEGHYAAAGPHLLREGAPADQVHPAKRICRGKQPSRNHHRVDAYSAGSLHVLHRRPQRTRSRAARCSASSVASRSSSIGCPSRAAVRSRR